MGGESDPKMTVTVGSQVSWILSAQIASPNAAPTPLTSDPMFNELPVFTDQSMAARVATALNHAVDLCGGKPAQRAFSSRVAQPLLWKRITTCGVTGLASGTRQSQAPASTCLVK